LADRNNISRATSAGPLRLEKSTMPLTHDHIIYHRQWAKSRLRDALAIHVISPQVRPILSQVIFTLSMTNRVAAIGNLSENWYLAQGKDGVHCVP
jgi:hypothetical protein